MGLTILRTDQILMLKAEAEAGAAPPPKSTVDAFNTYINI
jgi:hypothetical protein